MKISILTSTYNRGKKLNCLYNSLVSQTNKNFEWIIIDDGSTDNTKSIVSEFIKENKFKIKYLYQKNSGKHKAINNAMKNVNGEMIFIVDSDDYLTEDAIETVQYYYRKYRNNNEICGFSFLRGYPNGKINNKKFPKEEWNASYIEARINTNIAGDKAEVFFTDVIKKYPFPEYDGEKFVSEDIVWIEMAKIYSMININKIIYISEYLEDGLTKNGRINKIKSPIGMFERAKKWIYKDIRVLARMKGILMYIIYGKFINKSFKDLFYELKETEKSYTNPIFFIIEYIPGIVIYNKWKRNLKDE